MRRHEEVLRVVEVSVFRVLDGVDDARLEIEEQSAGHVVVVVRLVEEDILAVARVAVRGVLLQNAVVGDAVLRAQLLPKLRADLVAALANLKGDHLARHREAWDKRVGLRERGARGADKNLRRERNARATSRLEGAREACVSFPSCVVARVSLKISRLRTCPEKV